MAAKCSNKIFGQCRCCLKNGLHKDIMEFYYKNGARKVYHEVFLDCFNLFLSTDPQISRLICTSCINRLNDATDFKIMVAASERRLLSEITGNNTVFINVPETGINSELHIKSEVVKYEPEDVDMEEAAADDDAAKDNIVHTETVSSGTAKREIHRKSYTSNIQCTFKQNKKDLIEGEAELLTRFSRYIRPLPTRESLYTILPSFAKHLDLLKDQVILPKVVKKILETEPIEKNHIRRGHSSEKHALVTNSAMLLENSNLTPFKSKKKTGFPCFYCLHYFETLDKMKEHQAKTHKKSEVRKLLTTSGPESLVVYVDTTDLKCTICDEDIANINDLKSHLIKIHRKLFYPGFTERVIPFKLKENNIFVCQMCGFSFETFGSIERHMNTHYRNYICTECGTGFITKCRLKVHVKSMHVDGAFPCEQCKKVYASQQKLKNHVDTVHNLVKRFKCPKCFERFSEYFKRQKHMVAKHGVAPLHYKCNVCDKLFDRRYTLSRHMKRDHLDERDFQCEKCSYKCFSNNELRVHMIKHNGERIYECAVCKKAYARKKTLREHMRIHNNDRRFTCAICSQAFVQKCSLKGHMKTHHIEYNPTAI